MLVLPVVLVLPVPVPAGVPPHAPSAKAVTRVSASIVIRFIKTSFRVYPPHTAWDAQNMDLGFVAARLRARLADAIALAPSRQPPTPLPKTQATALQDAYQRQAGFPAERSKGP
ncbi:MAG: hypothetical protein OHK0022_56060 [Roseiflexaceae bacterium]